MKNKYISNIKFNGIIENNSNDASDMESIVAELGIEIEKLFQKYNIEYNSYELMTLNKKKYSIEKCEKCGNYLTNRDKNPLGINEECFYDFIYNGGNSNNSILCEMCLPEEHRWS